MKTHLIYLGLLAMVLLALWSVFQWGQSGWESSQRHESNVESLRKDTTKKATTIRLKRNEFDKLFSDHAKLVREHEKEKGVTTQQAHTIRFLSQSVLNKNVDRIPFPDRISSDSLSQLLPEIAARIIDSLNGIYAAIENQPIQQRFERPCITNTVTYYPDSGTMTDSLVADPRFHVYIDRETPKYWFWRLKWNRSKWPVVTNVENECGWDVSENFIFDFR